MATNFSSPFIERPRASLGPFILVVEGSIPDETNKEEGYWASFGTDPTTRPADPDVRVDRPAGAAGLGGGRGRHLRDLRRHSCDGGKSDGRMGLADYLGWKWKSEAGIPIVCVPGCPVQPDNMMETLLYLLYMAAGRAPMIPLDEALRPTWLFGQTVHEGCDRGGYYEQARFCRGVRIAAVHREAGMLGTGGAVQRRQARLDGRNRRMSQRRRHLHRLHHAGLSGQVHAVHEPAAGIAAVVQRGADLRKGDSRVAKIYPGIAEQGAELAPPSRGIWKVIK